MARRFTKKDILNGRHVHSYIGKYDVFICHDGIFFVVKVYFLDDIIYKMRHDTYAGARKDFVSQKVERKKYRNKKHLVLTMVKQTHFIKKDGAIFNLHVTAKNSHNAAKKTRSYCKKFGYTVCGGLNSEQTIGYNGWPDIFIPPEVRTPKDNKIDRAWAIFLENA